MKISILMLVSLAAASISFSMAPEAIDPEEIPLDAREFIADNFPHDRIAYSAKISAGRKVLYHVLLEYGTDMDFDSLGQWTKISHPEDVLPDTVIPVEITDFLVNTGHDRDIVKILRTSKGYEIEFYNGSRMTFDKKFRIKSYTD